MPLYVKRPQVLPVDRSCQRLIEFTSTADGTVQRADLYTPAEGVAKPVPVVIAPHPITWSAAEEYNGGLTGGYKRGYHAGWYGLADRYKVVIVMPHGHSRRIDGCSLASPEQISDIAQLINVMPEFQVDVNHNQIYACGESMGGQEALVVAGQNPELFAAVVAFNPIVDLAAWQLDLANSENLEIRGFGTDQRVIQEVGGTPSEVPLLYAERSPTNYVDGLKKVPTLIFWSNKDLIVPRQATHHAYHLYQMVKSSDISSPIAEYNHTHIHGEIEFNETTCFQLHEWCDYELALHWLLVHKRAD